MQSETYPLTTLADTERLAKLLASVANPPLTIALSGTLGAGKTQFVRFFCDALDVPADTVTSPTYVLLQKYRGRRSIYHLDFYRLESEAQVWDLGIDEIFEQFAIVLIEWAEKFQSCLPLDRIDLLLEHEGEGQSAVRKATVTSTGEHSATVLEAVRSAPNA